MRPSPTRRLGWAAALAFTALATAGCDDGATANATDAGAQDDAASDTGGADANATTVDALDPVRVLSRASLDLRGTRPKRDELHAVADDPSALDALLDAMLADPRFAESVRDWWAVPFRTRVDTYTGRAAAYGLDDDRAFHDAIGEEPLRIIGHVASEDLPWTEVVTGDWTMVDDQLAEAWPVERVSAADADGWSVARYDDGRPAAGVLATNAMWWRYSSTVENYNRGRANAVSRVLLCTDFLSRPVEFPRTSTALDPDALVDQTQTNPACVSCHAALDPLASYLFGFSYFNEQFVSERYNVSTERLWRSGTGVAPAYFGEPAHGFTDLGGQIAADPRFVACAVETTFRALVPDARDSGATTDALTRHRETFIRSGTSTRALVASIVDSSLYRADAPRWLSVEQLADAVQDLTGFVWTFQGWDILGSDLFGLRTLAGGADGRDVTEPSGRPSTTAVLTVARFAELAALYATRDGSDAALFDTLGPSDDATTAAGRAQVAAMVERAHGRLCPVDDPYADALVGLWRDVASAEGSNRAGWAGVITALLRDPDFLVY